MIEKCDELKIVLITANVGSLFEDVENLLCKWLEQLTLVISSFKYDIVALHMQEFGGKDYETSMYLVDTFVKKLLAIDYLKTYSRYCMFLNTDYTFQEEFTALGNAYFISDTIKDVSIWNFKDSIFVDLVLPRIYSGDNETMPFINAFKYPKAFFPVVRWSRKGTIQVRLKIGGKVINFINVHLFHDASNLIALKEDPSIYSRFRKNALEHTLNTLKEDESNDLFAIFGDFNFRLNTFKLLEELSYGCNTVEKLSKGELSNIYLQDVSGDTIVEIGKKAFIVNKDHDKNFLNNRKLCEELDNESQYFSGTLFEFEKTFPPSYPYSENVDEPSEYLEYRCPSWCDRVFLSKGLEELVCTDFPHCYDVIGLDTCMGDHKPVFLSTQLHVKYEIVQEPGTKKIPTNVILNGVQIDTKYEWNIHDYAVFIRTEFLSDEIRKVLENRKPRLPRKIATLWMKLKAVTIFLGSHMHQKGSWYTNDSAQIEDLVSVYDDIEETDLFRRKSNMRKSCSLCTVNLIEDRIKYTRLSNSTPSFGYVYKGQLDKTDLIEQVKNIRDKLYHERKSICEKLRHDTEKSIAQRKASLKHDKEYPQAFVYANENMPDVSTNGKGNGYTMIQDSHIKDSVQFIPATKPSEDDKIGAYVHDKRDNLKISVAKKNKCKQYCSCFGKSKRSYNGLFNCSVM